MSIYQLNMHGLDKVQTAIRRLQTFEPPDGGYYLAFSGGKDSVVIKTLADMAGVRYDTHYNVTGIDPPELVYFIRQHHPDVIWEYPRDKDGEVLTMWRLIQKKKMPPTRIVRYCCESLKEGGGAGQICNNRSPLGGISTTGKQQSWARNQFYKKTRWGVC